MQPLTPTQGDAEAATVTATGASEDARDVAAAATVVAAATTASEDAPTADTAAASPGGGCSAVVVSADGCSLAPGAAGVRVLDYIAAKYSFHFKDAGLQAAQ